MRRFTMQAVVSWLGITSVCLFFVSLTFLTTWRMNKVMRESLHDRSLSVATVLERRITDAVLTDDGFSASLALQDAVGSMPEARYAFVQTKKGEITAHTFRKGFPVALMSLPGKDVVDFRSSNERIMDVRIALFEGELGHLHLGVSLEGLRAERHRFMGIMAAILFASLMLAMLVAQRIGVLVGRPLNVLAKQATDVPTGELMPEDIEVTGTAEVRTLSTSFRDMVDRLRKLEAESRAVQKRMIASERLAALGELAAGLAHEILNPLDGVLEGCRHVRRHTPEEDSRSRYLGLMYDGLVRIERVMRQMLSFARQPIDGPRLEPCCATEVVATAAELCSPQLERNGVNIHFGMPAPIHCLTDRGLLEQALVNLILNAADALEEVTPKRIIVTVSQDYASVSICVEDSGPGIPAELRKKIFVPFFTTKAAGNGTGLGLAISRQNMHHCGGDLVLNEHESSVGGARFTITLPRADQRKKG